MWSHYKWKHIFNFFFCNFIKILKTKIFHTYQACRPSVFQYMQKSLWQQFQLRVFLGKSLYRLLSLFFFFLGVLSHSSLLILSSSVRLNGKCLRTAIFMSLHRCSIGFKFELWVGHWWPDRDCYIDFFTCNTYSSHRVAQSLHLVQTVPLPSQNTNGNENIKTSLFILYNKSYWILNLTKFKVDLKRFEQQYTVNLLLTENPKG